MTYTVAVGADLQDVVQTAYTKQVKFSYDANLFFHNFAQMERWKGGEGSDPKSNAVVFTIYSNLTAISSALSDEYSDATAVAPSDSQKTITMAEYGNVVSRTTKLNITSFDNVDLSIAKLVGKNMADSQDILARAAFDAQTGANYVSYANSGTKATIEASDTCSATWVRKIYNKLARQNVPKINGFYMAILHPDVIYDLKAATGSGAFRTPKEYADPDDIYTGELGEFEGFRFLNTTNAKLEADAGSGAVDVYSSYFFGEDPIGYALGLDPHMRITGPFDNLGRVLNIGWYGIFGYGELRPYNLHKLFSASAVGDNS